MPRRRQNDVMLAAIEVNALRVAEIATLRRECAFWRERCRLLEALAESDRIEQKRGASTRRNGRVMPTATA